MNLKTDYPIAYDSPDHLVPHGVKRENNTSEDFIFQIEKYFKRKISMMDLGCAGGQLVIDFIKNGHEAIGLEGSDFNLINKKYNWPNENLKTCDISRPFRIDRKFDLITCFDVIEHIPTDRLGAFFDNIDYHLKKDGLFVVVIGPFPYVIDGITYHQTNMTMDGWRELLEKNFKITNLKFSWGVRSYDQLVLRRKNE